MEEGKLSDETIDEILTDMILLGHVEISGMRENGEVTYRLTEQGERYVEETIGLVRKH